MWGLCYRKKMKLTIESKIPERDFIEGLLNMKHSGASNNYLMLTLGIHAMANKWKYDKMVYYLNLLGVHLL